MRDCGRCGQAVPNSQGYVLYQSPDPHEMARIVVHGECIAEDVAAGVVVRVSGFAFRLAPMAEEQDLTA